jgi:hypothetical protein
MENVMEEVKKKSSLKLQKGLAVALVLISVVSFMISSHTLWALLLFGGLAWFVVIRISE